MIKKSWDALLKTLKQGSVKLATRQLSKQDAKKYEKLVKEQRQLVERIARMLDSYDKKMEKISGLLAQSRKGEINRLESYIKKLQKELGEALARADLAVAETPDLQRELVDRQRQNGESVDDLRLRSLISELDLRGYPNKPKVEDGVYDESEEDSDDHDLDEEMEEIENPEPDEGMDEPIGSVVFSTEQDPDILGMEPDQLVAQIRDLSKELALHQQSPEARPSESLRIAKQIKDLHAILRQVDRSNEQQRDRIEVTDGFRHVFSQH